MFSLGFPWSMQRFWNHMSYSEVFPSASSLYIDGGVGISPGFHRDEPIVKDLGNWGLGEIYRIHIVHSAADVIYSSRRGWASMDNCPIHIYRNMRMLRLPPSNKFKPRTPTALTDMARALDRIVSAQRHWILQSYYKLHMKVGLNATNYAAPDSQPGVSPNSGVAR
ncbi:hypothetical protein N7508_007269 [Penicillium antarcticum]|uniref:uncharacterized protein n=1 Tax=Penicillium antarcticum TaxID=416450 RepID=UPI0023A39724|nr:uncharacterized protein N7508_007269 [Penicillium antarcticum]KAJ5302406.1 hypothetical protein N7508_007269 [Penicillium antarcticum]